MTSTTTYKIADPNNAKNEIDLGQAIEEVFGSNNCAFYAEDEDALDFSKSKTNQSLETSSTVILQHTLFVVFAIAIALNMTNFIYRYFYYYPALKYFYNPQQINITPIAVFWAIVIFAISAMMFTAGITRNPIYLVWGTGVIIMFIAVLFKISLTEKNFSVDSFNLADFFKLIEFNKYKTSLVSIIIQLLVWIATIIIGCLLISGVFTKVTATVSHLIFILCIVLVFVMPLLPMYNYSQ